MTSSARTMRRPLLGRIAAAAAGSSPASRACSAGAPTLVQLGVEPGADLAATRRGSRGGRARRAGRARSRRPGSAVRPRPAISAMPARAIAWYSATAADLVQRPDVEQVMRHAAPLGRGQLGRADVHADVELHRVGVDDLAAEPLGPARRRGRTCRWRSARRRRRPASVASMRRRSSRRRTGRRRRAPRPRSGACRAAARRHARPATPAASSSAPSAASMPASARRRRCAQRGDDRGVEALGALVEVARALRWTGGRCRRP